MSDRIEKVMNGAGSAGNGVAFLVAAAFMLGAIAAFCSSPQTAEINADTRASTLFKWVWIGELFGVGMVVLAALMDSQHKKAIYAGGLVTGAAAGAAYWHAKVSGLASSAPGTEGQPERGKSLSGVTRFA